MTNPSYIALKASAARHEGLVREAEVARLAARVPRRRRAISFALRLPALRLRHVLRRRLELEL